MHFTFVLWILFLVSLFGTPPAISQNLIIYAPYPLIGEWVQSRTQVKLFLKPGSSFEYEIVPFIKKGQSVRIGAATRDQRWYRVQWRVAQGGWYRGWIDSASIRIHGAQRDVESTDDRAAWRGNHENFNQDRTRRRFLSREAAALRRMERQEAISARRAAREEQARLAREEQAQITAARLQREQAQREQAAIQAAKEAAAQRERQRQQEEARRLEQQRIERERQIQMQREREAQERAEQERQRQVRAREAQAARERAAWGRDGLWIFGMIYGALCFLPLSALYRDRIESVLLRFSHPGERQSLGFFLASGLCLGGAVWMLKDGQVFHYPFSWIMLSVLGLPFWFYIPGLFTHGLIFLHSLVVPHPMEAAFERVLRGESLSREEAAQVAEAMYNAQRDGIPVDWRVRSQVWRLERLTALMGKEQAFMETMSDYILNQQRTGRRS